MKVTTIRGAVDAQSELQGGKVFLLSPETGRALTFADLRRDSQLLGAMLRAAGLETGDKVAFLMDNGLATAELFLGAMYSGYVAVPLNVRAGAASLSYMLEHCDAKVVFVAEQYRGLLGEALESVRRDIRVIDAGEDGDLPAFEAVAEIEPPAEIEPDDAAMLIYSSGSTGKPKGAIHTHSSVMAHGRNSIAGHKLTEADRSLLVLPLYHINAECVTLVPTLLSGGSVAVAHRFVVTKFWDWVEELGITWSALVPTIVSELVDWKDGKERRAAYQRIRFFRSSSAPLSPALQQQFLDKFPIPLLQAMGSTEGGNVFSNPQPPKANKIGSPGLPWGFETRIVDREGVDVPRGESGEVLLRGAGLMRGYYKDPEGTAAVVDSEGWLHTGDLARQDEDGYFFVVGRSKELIIKGGVNIAPRQIDEVLESHAAVLEAAAVGVPDRYFGEDVVAFVVLRPEGAADERQLLAFCETRLGHFKSPSRIHFLKELPKGPSGKVQRLRLLDPAVLEAVAATAQPATETTVSAEQAGGQSIEQIIAGAWAEVLNVPQVDGETNFFALGGHSLLAIQCLSKLRDRLPIVLSLADFFENSTVSEQAALVRKRLHRAGDAPSGQESGNLEQSLLQQVVHKPEEKPIPRLDPSQPHPLSPAQQGLWFLGQLIPDVPVYNESEAVRLSGELNVEALEKAMNAVVDSQPVLRSTIRIINEVPHAVAHPSWPLRFKRIDLSALPAAERESEAERLLIAEPRLPYHLETEPGIRVTLLELSPRDHVLILMMHHIVCDWASEGIIWRQLSAAYRSQLNGQASNLPVAPVSFGDYAAYQQQQLAANSYAADLDYWEETLKGAPPLLELPADRSRPAMMSYSGNRFRWKLSNSLTEALRDTSRREKTSLFTIFAAALDTLLYRYSGSDDILLGIPLADRDHAELDAVVGYLLHMQVLRARLSGQMSFRELLSKVQKAALDLYVHRAVPFDQVVHRLQQERNLSYTPVFQVLLNWRDRDQLLSFIGLEGLAVESLLAAAASAKFDLYFQATDMGDEIWLELEYNTDLFDHDRMLRMMGHWQAVLEAVAADTAVALAQIPILTAPERQQLLVEWNNTGAEYPKNTSLAQLVEEQVERTPDAIAVASGDKHLSFRELNARANQLAHELMKHGAGPEQVVGLCVDRSVDLVVGLLAIVKTGGAYLPLDPIFPADRLSYMLEDSGAQLLLAEERLLANLPKFGGTTVLLEDEAWQRNQSHNPSVPVGPDNLAYLIYTSGSTGKPKGVQVPRGALTNFLWSMRESLELTAQDRALAVTTISFDIAGLELWLPLLVGAKTVVASRESVIDGHALRNLLDSHDITFMQATPVTWRLLFENEWPGKANLQAACGGEALPPELAARLQPAVGRLWNLYGPTETTIWSTASEITNGRLPVSIGRPLANTQIYILDAGGQPTPIGIAGELCIGGDGVARGYLNRPELTAEKFVADPFQENGARMYRTGDLARYHADGNIECMGRNDFQVKVRGFRIELGEIEARLVEHPAVRQAVVIARADASGEKRLIAYYINSGEQSDAGAEQFRSHLSANLPEYMVPAAYVRLDAFPLTNNGKIDRKALPEPGTTAFSTRRYEAPSSEVERTTAEIWQEVLGVPKVGRDDNFFDLGGTSMLIIRVLRRLRQAFAKEISVVDLFRYTTVRTLAQHLTGGVNQSSTETAQVDTQARRDAMRRQRQLRQDRASEVLKGAPK